MKILKTEYGDIIGIVKDGNPENVKNVLSNMLDKLELNEAYSCSVYYAKTGIDYTFTISGDEDMKTYYLTDIDFLD